MTWILQSVSVRGVKGVLDRSGQFKLPPKDGKPQSIAVFGRNGQGKSGYADAIEYLFSVDGEVAHLGKGGPDSEQGGKHAIPHVLANERGINPEISTEFVHLETGERVSVRRPVIIGRNDIRPPEIDRIVIKAPAHRILRQHDLRRFLVDMPPGEKFVEFAKWIGLERIAKLLSNLVTVENTLKDTDVDREIIERQRSIKSHTAGAVQTYDLQAILKWCEQEVKKYISLSEAAIFSSVVDLENAIQTLKSHRESLILRSQAAQAYTTRISLDKCIKNLSSGDGLFQRLRASVPVVIVAEQQKIDAQNRATQIVFKEVWESARSLFEKESTTVCPVCLTPWQNTTVGSVDNALVSLKESLSSLEQFKVADNAYARQRSNLNDEVQKFEYSLSEIIDLTSSLAFTTLVDDTRKLQSLCTLLKSSTQTIRELELKFVELFAEAEKLITQSIPDALLAHKIENVPESVTNIDDSITHFEGIKEAIDRLETLKQQQLAVRSVEKQFNIVANAIRSEAKDIAENAVKVLRADVEKIYKKIHPDDAVPNIFIEKDAEKKVLLIRVNFHSNERRVPPAGYLSESQINTIGIALFLSSVHLFNKEFPFVFLDDIVSSYDADNRARIVDVLAEYMRGFQVFLTTHDERFYTHLKHRLEGENWIFERIVGYEFERGPRRESDNLHRSQIDALIKEGNPQQAGNVVRQFIEEWFDKVSEKYEVYTLHKRSSREYQRTLYDYWQPLLDRVKKLGAGFGNYFFSSITYERMKGSSIINYYSHYQANPYEWASIGDVEYIWNVFQEFAKLFNCHSCSKQLKFDRTDSKLYCTCGKAFLPTESPQP